MKKDIFDEMEEIKTPSKFVYERTDSGVKERHLKKYLMTLQKEDYPGFVWYQIKCINEEEEKMGSVSFKIMDTSSWQRKLTWIMKLETLPEFGYKGIGTALLQVMEVISIAEGSKYIQGKYYPDNEFALPTYLKMGYCEPTSEDGWILSKSIDYDKVSEYGNGFHLEKKIKEKAPTRR